MSNLLNEIASCSWPVAARIWRSSCGAAMPPLNAHLETLEKPNLGAGKSGAPVCATGRISGPSMSLIRKFMWILK